MGLRVYREKHTSFLKRFGRPELCKRATRPALTVLAAARTVMAVDFAAALEAEMDEEESAVIIAPRMSCRMRHVLYTFEKVSCEVERRVGGFECGYRREMEMRRVRRRFSAVHTG